MAGWFLTWSPDNERNIHGLGGQVKPLRDNTRISGR